jgi:hypothetical protein
LMGGSETQALVISSVQTRDRICGAPFMVPFLWQLWFQIPAFSHSCQLV